jgi:DNA primase catalytic core
MPRIPDHELERLKREISLVRLAESRGVALKAHGKDLLGLCPFHDDHEPSLVISPDKNLWHCLGACQAGGSVIDWVMKAEGVSFRHAVELLRNDLPLVATSRAPVKATTVRKLAAPFTPNEDEQAVLNQVIGYYHETLKQSPEALAYLEKRGIRSSEAIERFKLGYANRTLGYRLPEKNRKEGAALRGQLQRLGLLRASGHEHFAGSLIVPIFDEAGHVTEVYGRKVNDKLRDGTAYHLYLPGPHKGVWNLDALKASKEIILCEALIDAMTFWCAGYRNVTAAYGVEGFTHDHLAATKHYGTERVLIAYDRDEAGEGAAQKLAEKLITEGIDCYRLQFPKGMDANDYALHVQPAEKSLGVVIRAAQWLGKGQAPAITTEASASEEAATLDLSRDAHFQQQLADVGEALRALDQVLPVPASLPSLAAQAVETEPPEPLPATPIPEAPRAELPAEVHDDEIVMVLGDRRYRVRGLNKNLSYDQLKVNVLVSRASPEAAGELLHVDTFDLYAARPRASFIHQAAVELGLKDEVIKKDLGVVLLKLEALQDAHIKKTLEPKSKAVVLDEAERREALALLKEPNLLERILLDFERCGLVGELTNKLVGYLAAVSRKLDAPLAILVQSTSAAGKSSLMEACLALMPDEERVQYSAMTGQSLFYMGEMDLKHKILAIVEEEGASRASYALKLLQSEGELTIASTGKDPDTGRLVTHEYRVEGPVMIFLTTTAIELDEELLNRCLVLTVDESREQTSAILKLQREKRTLEGLLAKKEKARLVKLHRNAQRLLKPLAVMNPYSRQLTFRDDRTRLRRDHEKYLTLIDTLALLHQYQRPVKVTEHNGERIEYVEVTLDDIETANKLAHEVLGRSLDELPPQTRRLLILMDDMVRERSASLKIDRHDYRFSRREVREATKWSDTQLKLHLARLTDMEYLLVHKGGRGQSFAYELLYDGQGRDGKPFLPGLLDVAQLKHAYDENRSGQNAQRSGSGRPPVGVRPGVGPGEKNNANALEQDASLTSADEGDKKAHLGPTRSAASYRSHAVPPLAAKG